MRRRLRTPAGRTITLAVIFACFYAFADPYNYVYALEVHRQKVERIREIAQKLGIDPQFLLDPQSAKRPQSSTAPLAQPQSLADAIARVKSHYALVAADSTLEKLAEVLKLSDGDKDKKKGQIRGQLKSLLREIDKNLLPPLPNGAPAVAQSRDRDMRNALGQLANVIKQSLNGPNALDDSNLKATLTQLSSAIAGSLTIRTPKPRWTKDPFPLKDTYRTAPAKPGLPIFGNSVSAVPPAVKLAIKPTAVPTDVAAFAQSLQTPAKAFTWVHDHIDWDSYSGVAKGSLGTLKEGSGNDWDQALLLRDLLIAQGYQAQIEWGTVTIPIAQAMNLAGTEDPMQAANLLATAGFDGVVLTSGSTPTAVQMTHAWVRAFVPFLPNRGVTNGTPDTWVRMDPSFKQYDYQPGVATIVPWNEDDYLQSSAVRSPIDFYSDKLWAYIRGNNLSCQNLSQVPKTGAIHAANFPFIPSTLTVHIDNPLGLAADAPPAQYQHIAWTLSDSGSAIASYSANLADLWGKKVTLTFIPATSDDAAIIASYGNLFDTPAYLIKLAPVFSVDDQQVAVGSAIAPGEPLDLNVDFAQPNVADDITHHDVVAGETHAFVLDQGRVPDTLLAARAVRLQALTGDAQLSEQLFLTGLRYMQHIDDGTSFAAGVLWQRRVKRVFEADVRRQVNVSYTVSGAPLRLVPAENNIDVARLEVGIVPISSDTTKRAEALSLAGMESSWREGAIWEETEGQQGISAAKALLLARLAGQTIQTVDAANVDAVLAASTLSPDVQTEIRGAIAQGRIAKLVPNPISLNRWSGTGYILEDPLTGAATYPISGALAGGSDTGAAVQGIEELLGTEPWLTGSPLGDLLQQLLALLGGGSSGSSGAPSTMQSDPLNLSSGNLYRTFTDFSIVARGIPVALTRAYNSRSTYDGPFGYGWTFNYGAMLIDNGDGTITWRDDSGAELLFVNYVSPAGKHLTLTQTGSGWTMRFKDGTVFTFNAAGLLVAQTDLNGNTVTINRDASGNISTIVDATGRTVLTFGYSAGKITTVTDLAGRNVIYGYTGEDLTQVTDTAGKVWTMSYDLGHHMTSFADPLGNTHSYDYDADGRVMDHTDATGAEEFFHYDIAARQSVITDRRGGDRLITFDDLGRATSEADPAGNVVQATFDADNNRTQTVDSRGNITSYEFDAQGNTTRQTNPDSGIITTTYDQNSRPLVSTDAAGAVTSNSYDSAGNLLSSSRTVEGVTETTANTYDSSGELLSTTDPNGGVTSMTWSPTGTLATRTDAANNTTTMTSDALGRITAIKDPAGNSTTLGYDNKDRILTMTDPYNNTTSFVYDDAGRRTSVTTPRGTTSYSYDPEGRVLSVSDPLGDTTRTGYDAAGDVVSRTDARGNVTKYAYDLDGRVTQMTDAAGGVTTYGYCAGVGGGAPSCSSCGGGGGSFCDLYDADGNHMHQEFDTMGRVVSVTDALSHTSFSTYDKAGRKTLETDANGNATAYGYDEAGHLVSVTEADGAVTSYTYDRSGNKLTQKDANGNVWSYSYDALNRLTQEKDPLGRTTSYTYDALGNLQTKTDGKGQVTTYGYNIRRLTSVTYPGGADNFTYDALGRRITASNGSVSFTYGYDALNRITSVVNTTYNQKVNYAYDAAGNLATQTVGMNGLAYWVGQPGAVTRYSYDAKNRLVTIADNLGGTFRLSYDPMDRRTSLAYPNGDVTNYTYDNAYRLSAIATKNGQGQIIDAWSYQYDAVGNRLSKTDMNGKVESYSYDNVYRLTQASYPDGSREAFTYDPVGNRLTRTDESGTTTAYSYDIANQMLKAGSDTFTYDANGSMLTKTVLRGTTNFVYDGKNRVASITGPDGNEANVWGPDGQRVQIQSDEFRSNVSLYGSPIRPIYDLQGNPIADGDTGTSGGVLRYRVYGPGVDEPLVEVNAAQGARQTSYFHHDALGSITVATDPNGALVYRQSYKAFGQSTFTPTNTDPNFYTRLSYTSRENSLGTLYQYRSRYYDAGYGRFGAADDNLGAASNPPSQNRYIYAVNRPIVYTDPSGNVLGGPNATISADPRFAESQLWAAGGGDADAIFFAVMGAEAFIGLAIVAGFVLLGAARSIVYAVEVIADYVVALIDSLLTTLDFISYWLETMAAEAGTSLGIALRTLAGRVALIYEMGQQAQLSILANIMTNAVGRVIVGLAFWYIECEEMGPAGSPEPDLGIVVCIFIQMLGSVTGRPRQ